MQGSHVSRGCDSRSMTRWAIVGDWSQAPRQAIMPIRQAPASHRRPHRASPSPLNHRPSWRVQAGGRDSNPPSEVAPAASFQDLISGLSRPGLRRSFDRVCNHWLLCVRTSGSSSVGWRRSASLSRRRLATTTCSATGSRCARRTGCPSHCHSLRARRDGAELRSSTCVSSASTSSPGTGWVSSSVEPLGDRGRDRPCR